MKKTGIITFHNADNSGALLQAYALQNTINQISEGAEIIDYRCQAIEEGKNTVKCNCVKDVVKFIPLKLYYYIKRRGFESFRKNYLIKSQKAYDINTIKDSLNEYDVFVAGSDQIWNLECSENDYTYFLDFVPENKDKYSYAASIGNYVFKEEEKHKIKPLLKDFQKVSVREKTATEILREIGISDVNINPDPVFLLSDNQWKKLMSKRLYKKKYILVYLIQKDVNILRNAEKYARKYNCKIINNKKSIEFMLHNSPCDFLSWIYNADCVFTNSFHGTALSLIFNKKLAADVEIVDGTTNKRVKDLLKEVNAEKCIIGECTLEGEIPNVRDALKNMTKNAVEYLENIYIKKAIEE